MIQAAGARLATREDIPEIERMMRETGFPELLVEGEPWRDAFGDIQFLLAPGVLIVCTANEDDSVRVHVAVEEGARGAYAVGVVRDAIRKAFQGTNTKRIDGLTPPWHRAAQRFNAMVGMHAVGMEDGMIRYEARRDQWLLTP